MTFEEMFDKYMQGSTVSKHQAKFIWNHAISQLEDRMIRNFHPDVHNKIFELVASQVQENKVPNYF